MGRRVAFLAVACACLCLGCGETGDDGGGGGGGTGGDPLTAKFINTGSLAITALHHRPVGVLSGSGWESEAWGDNILPVGRLEQNQFVLFADFPRQDLDMVATFDATPSPRSVKWNVPAQWIGNAEFLTIHAGSNPDGSSGQGHQFGLESYSGEVDVTP